MFTGIIEATGVVEEVKVEGLNKRFRISCAIAGELKPEQSVTHNGVCLSVTEARKGDYWVTAVNETLQRSNLGKLTKGDQVNLERCMVADGRFDGHIVQGHVDQVGIVRSIKDQQGSWLIDFEYDPKEGNITVEKGSIAINGVSLTCFNTKEGQFTVAIIPSTYEKTNIGLLSPGDTVNLEFDIIGKYVQRLSGLSTRKP